MSELKAIPTTYKGIEFRSRLEARWAVFFDACGVDWEYEPEGFILSDGTWYLPDFLLHDVYPVGDLWVEIKGKLTDKDLHKVDLFSGTLEEKFYSNPIIILGPIPKGKDDYELSTNLNRSFESVISSWRYIGLSGSYEALLGIDYEGRFRIFDYFDFRSCDGGRTCQAYAKGSSAKFEHSQIPNSNPVDIYKYKKRLEELLEEIQEALNVL